MRSGLEIAAGALAAVFLFVVLVRIHPSLILVLNPFSLVVVYLAIVKGETFGAVAGSVCGLVQDAFSVGVFGHAGLTKTLLGFLAGSASRKINIAPFSRKFLFVFVLSAGELAFWTGTGSLVFSKAPLIGNELILLQPPAIALAISLAFHLPGWKNALRKP